jgi:hypothetical protein
MKTIFDKEVPQTKFERFIQKIQSKVMILGLIFLISVLGRLIYQEFDQIKELFIWSNWPVFASVIVIFIYVMHRHENT